MSTGQTLTRENLHAARKLLFTVTDLLDANNIPYQLEGGTLLGIVRDKELLPWDHDVDLSAPHAYGCRILKLRLQLLFRGYKLSVRKSNQSVGPIKAGDYSVIKIKPLIGYLMRWFAPRYKSFVVLDLFLKTNDDTHSYWQAQGKIMRVEKKFHESFEYVEYLGKKLKAPHSFKEFLTKKYGDWSVPVKDWSCGKDERTIVNIHASLGLFIPEIFQIILS